MTRPVVVLGGGGCGREVLDVIDALNAAGPYFAVVGVMDDGSPRTDLLDAFGVRHLGSTVQALDLDLDHEVVMGFGEPEVRAEIDARVTGRTSPTLVHPSVAMSARRVELAQGVVICANTSIQNHVQIAKHVHINQNCTVGHDVRIGSYAVVSPLVAISGNVHIEDAVFIGAGATILPGVRIGSRCRVGAGAVVTKDVEPGATVAGVPARPLKPRTI